MTVSAIASDSLADSARQTRNCARHLGTLSTTDKNAAIASGGWDEFAST
ncbi:hypothetical protein [Baaleninema simplex]|nr:hypothetical protein [Baaleninema simplex]